MLIQHLIYFLLTILIKHARLLNNRDSQGFLFENFVLSEKFFLAEIKIIYKRPSEYNRLSNLQFIKVTRSLKLEFNSTKNRSLVEVKDIYEQVEIDIIADEEQGSLIGTKLLLFKKLISLQKINQEKNASKKELLLEFSQATEASFAYSQYPDSLGRDLKYLKLSEQLSRLFLVKNVCHSGYYYPRKKFNMIFVTENMTTTLEVLNKVSKDFDCQFELHKILLKHQLLRKTSRNSCYLNFSSSKFEIITFGNISVYINGGGSQIEDKWPTSLVKHITNHEKQADAFDVLVTSVRIEAISETYFHKLDKLKKIFVNIKKQSEIKCNGLYADLVDMFLWNSPGEGKEVELRNPFEYSFLFLNVNLLVFCAFCLYIMTAKFHFRDRKVRNTQKTDTKTFKND